MMTRTMLAGLAMMGLVACGPTKAPGDGAEDGPAHWPATRTLAPTA